jgi:hypothetical protein
MGPAFSVDTMLLQEYRKAIIRLYQVLVRKQALQTRIPHTNHKSGRELSQRYSLVKL